MEHSKEWIAKRAAKELQDADVVNLGIGLPTLVVNFLPQGVNIILQSENGYVGMGKPPAAGKEDFDIVNAGGKPSTIKAGGAFFNSATSFAVIRGGHVHVTILGALQVDEKGNLANWIIPGKIVPGMGGAMDLVVGSKKVIVAMEHTNKGQPKILKECTLPLTAKGEVDLIVTEMGVLEVTPTGLVLKEYNSQFTIKEIQEATGCTLQLAEDMKKMA